jgi:SAM-dependent methyltransferase
MPSPAAVVDPTNAEQARAWDGADGRLWTEHAERFDTSMAGYRTTFLDAARIGPTEKVLDIGCGTGQTTRDAARRATAGIALGIDLSAQMIGLARRLTAEQGLLRRTRYVHGDAQTYRFPAAAFDAAISRTGAMFFGRPRTAFANIGGALRPGGRLVLLCWQPADANEWFAAFFRSLTGRAELPRPPVGAPGPFSLSDPDRVRALLDGAGFVDVQVRPSTAPLLFGTDPADAESFLLGVLGWMLPADDPAARARAIAALRASLHDHHGPDGVRYGSAAWLVTGCRP